MGEETQIIAGKVKARFMQKIHPDTPIYRIFTLDRGLETIINKKLTLARPRRWDDPYENALYQRKIHTSDGADVSVERLSDNLYAQCWTENGNCDALWRIYSPARNGFRATTTVRKLLKAISENQAVPIRKGDCSIGKINYCHQEIVEELFKRIRPSDFTDSTGLKPIKFLLIKRNAFEYEREVRVAYNHPHSSTNTDGDFKSFDINPNELFERLLFDPRINDADFTEQKAKLEKSGYTKKIGKSNMYGKPYFDPITIE